jgi:hypothetical protein
MAAVEADGLIVVEAGGCSYDQSCWWVDLGNLAPY